MTTRYVEVHSLAVKCEITRVDGTYVALRPETHVTGCGDTELTALDDLRTALEYDRSWFCEVMGSTMQMNERGHQRRNRGRAVFCATGGKP
jgi:hypothetical protein